MGKGIKLSEKHGVNLAITLCPVCGKETGIAMLDKLKNDSEAPKYVLSDICDDCVKAAGNDKIYVLSYNGHAILGCATIKREALNIEVKGVAVLMDSNEFDKVFKK